MTRQIVAGPDARLALRLSPGVAFSLLVLLWLFAVFAVFLVLSPA